MRVSENIRRYKSIKMSQSSSLLRLPDELLAAIASYLTTSDLAAFGRACKLTYKISCEPLLWREPCVRTWRYWEQASELAEHLKLPPSQFEWRQLYIQRAQTDRQALKLFNEMLSTQQNRLARIQEITAHGYNVKDLLLKLKNGTPDSAEDVLARRYYAKSILGLMHRAMALEKWAGLQHEQPVKLEEAIGAYDLFVLSGERGDLTDIANELDRIAKCIKDEAVDGDAEFDQLTTRQKAVRIARYLRSAKLVGNPNQDDYHALRNNFISMALFNDVHTSLPLQSVVIYCAVAQRLGVDASPSIYPAHVHAVIQGPQNLTLDGEPCDTVERMYMDPWRMDNEVPEDQLRAYLSQICLPLSQHDRYLGATSTLDMAFRTGRNIVVSVEDVRRRHQRTGIPIAGPDIEAASYSTIWTTFLLGDSRLLQRYCLHPLIERFQVHFPEDLSLIETILPIFEGEHEHQMLVELIQAARTNDSNGKTPSPRDDQAAGVQYRVGQHSQHMRYGYYGFIIGWDSRCRASPNWIEQMRVDDLSRGREQPFYHVISDDKSARYVAEENIDLESVIEPPSQVLMQLAGRYFKRWDADEGKFESNIRDEYPDD
ncbi:Hemimethylated DNA-binding protein YccV like-domain-containing protein [Whalleya microplaca]|nr:Hemimethylated DNA-binding protein YccV like-domain-containing protein [Whalleya microplaca]